MPIGDYQTVNSQGWFDSSYKFTEPVRYFKANDPYYWQVDNIPIKQLEENVLWLKDQLAANPLLKGVQRSEITELQPFATENGREVAVRPGRYTARINDAYNKGINSLIHQAASLLEDASVAKTDFELDTDVLRKLIGDPDVVGALHHNGLYEYLQHHQSEPVVGTFLSWQHGYTLTDFVIGDGIGDANNFPKNKLAIWKNRTSPPEQAFNLQQLATEFTRVWGGAVRTAIVDIPSNLTIDVPEFSENDYRTQGGYNPAVRVDLLFIYSHPVDASGTTIPAPNGTSPTLITSPQLGILKGAGVVGLEARGSFGTGEIGNEFFESTTYENNKDKTTAFMTTDNGDAIDENNVYKITSPSVDLKEATAAFGEVRANFPSPDDLLNLAPLFQQAIETQADALGLIGQSILPVAYVIVRKGASTVQPNDVIDIRPFFRTTELAYNERAGVAAANPPLSFANPAVGKAELQRGLTGATSYVNGKLQVIESSLQQRPLAAGMICGGTKYGVEGALLGFMAEAGDLAGTGDQDLLQALKTKGHLPAGTTELPVEPAWDLAAWAEGVPSKGQYRNDRINTSVLIGYDDALQTNNVASTQLTTHRYPVVRSTYNAATDEFAQNASYCFVKKYIAFSNPEEIFTPGGVVDYDVQVSLANCAPISNTPFVKYDEAAGPQTDINICEGSVGLFVEKNGHQGFTVFVYWPGSQLFQGWRGAAAPDVTGEARFPLSESSDIYSRQQGVSSGFIVNRNSFVKSQNLVNQQNLSFIRFGWAGESYGHDKLSSFSSNPHRYLKPAIVTYPSVSFSVIGYSAGMKTFSGDTTPNGSSDNTITLSAPNFI